MNNSMVFCLRVLCQFFAAKNFVPMYFISYVCVLASKSIALSKEAFETKVHLRQIINYVLFNLKKNAIATYNNGLGLPS